MDALKFASESCFGRSVSRVASPPGREMTAVWVKLRGDGSKGLDELVAGVLAQSGVSACGEDSNSGCAAPAAAWPEPEAESKFRA